MTEELPELLLPLAHDLGRPYGAGLHYGGHRISIVRDCASQMSAATTSDG